jgi:hypothetical protein
VTRIHTVTATWSDSSIVVQEYVIKRPSPVPREVVISKIERIFDAYAGWPRSSGSSPIVSDLCVNACRVR